jgi:hypothetical protein
VDDIGWFTYAEIKELTTYKNVIEAVAKAIEEKTQR